MSLASKIRVFSIKCGEDSPGRKQPGYGYKGRWPGFLAHRAS